MPVRFSSEQFALCDAIAAEQWFDDMREVLFKHHKDIAPAQQDMLFDACRADCARLGIVSEMALHAYFDMSFALGGLLSAEDGYMESHAIFLKRYETADRLPIDMYERAG
jgi:uncharacterized protein YcaQ